MHVSTCAVTAKVPLDSPPKSALIPGIAPPSAFTAPSIAPAVPDLPTAPTYCGINLPGGGGLSVPSASNPVVTLPVTGTSNPSLITDSNVTGRPDNAAPRTATSP